MKSLKILNYLEFNLYRFIFIIYIFKIEIIFKNIIF